MTSWINLLSFAIIGAIVGYVGRIYLVNKQINQSQNKAKELLQEAKKKQQEILIQSREEALKVIEEAKDEEKKRREELNNFQNRLEQRQSLFDKKILALEERHQKLVDQAEHLRKVKEQIKQIEHEQLTKLEEIAQLTEEEAKQRLFEIIEQREKETLLKRLAKINQQSQEELQKQAKHVLTDVIERCAVSHAVERTTSTVHLPSDEMKGRIIGREGRNIRTIERLTGTEIIVDDSPETVIISAFNPIRRAIAKTALENLILDGRIQPSRIEKFIEDAKVKINEEVKAAGEEALVRVGVTGFDPKLTQLLGRLKFRTSYGQNVLQHSIEVSKLSVLLARELGANESIVRQAGLLHDIGKALDQEIEGTHPQIGKEIAEKFGLSEEIIIPIATHHDDKPPTLIATIVKVADAISGARPGARRDSYEAYLKRLEDLENLAKTFSGVKKTYALQAGREIRVFVTPEQIDDLAAEKLAREISKKIEEELKYPGEIKVTIIREKRVVEYAR